MKKIITGLSIVLITLFTGCGGSDSSSPDVTTATTMDIGTEYTMTSIGVITKTSTDANITLSASLDNNTTTAKLTSGSATCTGCTE